MTTCQEIQEWSETIAPQLGKEVAENVKEGYDFNGEVNDAVYAKFPPQTTPRDELGLRLDAVAWRAAAELTAYYSRIGEGYAESYHRTLKRMFEEG